MQITEQMVNDFNITLKNLHCSFKLDFDGRDNVSRCKIVPANSLFIDSSIINPAKEFYDVLKKFFAERGINNLSCNNTGTIFWSI